MSLAPPPNIPLVAVAAAATASSPRLPLPGSFPFLGNQPRYEAGARSGLFSDPYQRPVHEVSDPESGKVLASRAVWLDRGSGGSSGWEEVDQVVRTLEGEWEALRAEASNLLGSHILDGEGEASSQGRWWDVALTAVARGVGISKRPASHAGFFSANSMLLEPGSGPLSATW